MIEWFKARWQWVAGAAALLVALLVGFFSRRRSPVSTDTERRDAEDKAREQERQAEQERDKKVEDAKTEHDHTVAELEKQQHEKVEELRDKPEETTDYLLEVGKQMRKP